MSGDEIQHFKRQRPDGTVTALTRLRKSADGLFGEAYVEGDWVHSPDPLRYLGDPGAATPITADEAAHIIRDWDG